MAPNNRVLQIIYVSTAMISITGRENFGEQERKVPISLVHRRFVVKINSPLGNWMFIGEIGNITNLSWMRGIDKRLISLTPVGNIQGVQEVLGPLPSRCA
jgi:hypothetical protein